MKDTCYDVEKKDDFIIILNGPYTATWISFASLAIIITLNRLAFLDSFLGCVTGGPQATLSNVTTRSSADK